MNLQYVNKIGNTVELTVSAHAMMRFIDRYGRAFPCRPMTSNPIETLVQYFRVAEREVNLSLEYRRRRKKYGEDTLYFRAYPFMFIVRNAIIVTVELAAESMRSLNKLRDVPESITSVRLKAFTIDQSGKPRMTALGRFELARQIDSIERLKYDHELKDQAASRLREKRPHDELLSVHIDRRDSSELLTVYEYEYAQQS